MGQLRWNKGIPILLQKTLSDFAKSERVWFSGMDPGEIGRRWMLMAQILLILCSESCAGKIFVWAMEDHRESGLVEMAFQLAVKNCKLPVNVEQTVT